MTQSFLSSRLVFQGDRLPPSSAVSGKNQDGYYIANKGKTVFPFSFELPLDSPRSYTFQNMARLRYMVMVIVNFRYKGHNDVLFKSREAIVVDRWVSDILSGEPITAINHRNIQRWNAKDELIQLEATINKNIVIAGTTMLIDINVFNGSSNKVHLLRYLRFKD